MPSVSARSLAPLPATQDRSVTVTPNETTFLRRPRGRFWRRILLAGGALGFLGIAFGFGLYLREIARHESVPLTADGIAVLTGGAQRIGDAANLLGSGHGRRLLISGVNAKNGREEVLRANPDLKAYLDCCVDLDYRARNTIGNAIETRRWARTHAFRSLLVVTSNYHMPRALTELQHALPDVALIPYPVVADPQGIERWWRDPLVARLLLAEYVKYLASLARTRLEDDPERSLFAIVVGGRKPSVVAPD